MRYPFCVLQINKKSKEKEENAYLKAGSVATEVLSSIRTIFAFGGEYKEEKRLFGVIMHIIYYILPGAFELPEGYCVSVQLCQNSGRSSTALHVAHMLLVLFMYTISHSHYRNISYPFLL